MNHMEDVLKRKGFKSSEPIVNKKDSCRIHGLPIITLLNGLPVCIECLKGLKPKLFEL